MPYSLSIRTGDGHESQDHEKLEESLQEASASRWLENSRQSLQRRRQLAFRTLADFLMHNSVRTTSWAANSMPPASDVPEIVLTAN